MQKISICNQSHFFFFHNRIRKIFYHFLSSHWLLFIYFLAPHLESLFGVLFKIHVINWLKSYITISNIFVIGNNKLVIPLLSFQQKALDQAIPVRSPEAIAAEDIKAETLEKLFENKSVAEKRLEMEKKLESLRKKQDKERQKSLEGSGLAEKRSSKFYMSSKLVKRLSSKNM